MRTITILNLKKLLAGSSGFTLVEAAIALAILSAGVGLIGTSVFQVLAIQRFWQDDRFAVKETRHAGSWFAGDVLRATATDLADDAPPVDNVTLTLNSGVTVIYSLSGGETLVRQEGSDQNVVARDVASAGFTRSGNLVTLTLGVKAARGGTETLSLQNYLRLTP